MKLNSPKSIATAEEVFRSYHGSWTAAREAAHRDPNGVLVIPKSGDASKAQVPEVRPRRKAG